MSNKQQLSHLSLLIALFCLLLSSSVFAQTETPDNNRLHGLEKTLKKDFFSVGMLVQGIADFQIERKTGYNGFSVGKGRFKFSGILNSQFGYGLQASLLKSPALLDAYAFYKPSPNFTIKAGQFMSPFTHEFLTSAASILFVRRSTVVKKMAPIRQLGLQVDGFTLGKRLRFTGAIFNGNNFGNNRNHDNHFQYVGRVEANFTNKSTKKSAKIGISLSYEQKKRPAQTGNIQATFAGEQILLGSYFHVDEGKFLFDGEVIYSWLKPQLGQEANPYGYYATAGYHPSEKTTILLRYDSFTGDYLSNDSDSIIAGFNYSPSRFSKLKLNAVLPINQSAYSGFLAAFQLNF